ncbi:MAG: FCD domain-containing protein, partial [Synergistales bacterium]|nr:FCD domain-containing protein [Synergistales bacterium]
ETLALKYAIDNLDKKKVEELLKELDNLERNGFPIKDTQRFDEEFHLGLLVKGSGNKWLEKFANGVIDLIKMTTRLSMNPRAAGAEHREILKAIVQRNLSKAMASLEAHLERSRQEALAELEGGERGGTAGTRRKNFGVRRK